MDIEEMMKLLLAKQEKAEVDRKADHKEMMARMDAWITDMKDN
jgi:hypothetical protein